MKKSLPARPNLEHLRTQAKQLLSKLRAGDAAAARTMIEYLPAAKGMAVAQVRREGFRLADAQSAIARQSGFAAWPGLARHVDALRTFEGEWQFVSLEVEGNSMPAAMVSHSRLLIDGDRFRTESPDANYEGVFNLDVEADPAHIDIEFVEGPEAGQWSYGIFRFDGDDVILCLGLTGASRPATFATSRGSGHALERLKRSSQARPDNVTGGRRGKEEPAAAPAPALVDEKRFALNMTPLLKRLQGEWTPLALITDGQPLAEAFLPFGSRTFTDNETKVVFGGQAMVHAKVHVDDTQTPIAIDYLNIGRGARSVTRGILEIVGDVVRICMAPAGGGRPADFSSEKGSGRVLSEWKRK